MRVTVLWFVSESMIQDESGNLGEMPKGKDLKR
jgi:hypothetical protein